MIGEPVAQESWRDVLCECLEHATSLTPIDRQLAVVMLRRSEIGGEPAVAAALAIALLSRARRDGHSLISFADLATQSLLLTAVAADDAVHAEHHIADGSARDAAPAPRWPVLPYEDVVWWRRHLTAEPMTASVVDVDGSGHAYGATGADITASLSVRQVAPVVVANDTLQFRRYRDAEQRIGAAISARIAHGGGRFRIITGGPGTGKTTQVAKLLLASLEANPALRIQLAAPTGKAAARITESLRLRLDAEEASADLRAHVPAGASTLHRLLGHLPVEDRFRMRQGHPLAGDLVIVDEASMVDVLMMDALLAALPERAQLVLVGDHHQLASVEAGDVLGALCREAESRGPGSDLHGAVERLTHSWRFDAHPGIGALADAILAGDLPTMLRVLRDDAHPEVTLTSSAPHHASTSDPLLDSVAPHLHSCRNASSPAELLAALDGFRIVCPEREGPLGVSGLCTRVEDWLAAHGAPMTGEWYHGRPVLVTANDYATQLFNGDVGVAWQSEGELLVHFRSADGGTRALAPSRLPAVQTAWAMTVHKAQGSEFDDVLVVLPTHASRVSGRELLYTAVTRARSRVTIAADVPALTAALATSAQRASGLARWLT